MTFAILKFRIREPTSWMNDHCPFLPFKRGNPSKSGSTGYQKHPHSHAFLWLYMSSMSISLELTLGNNRAWSRNEPGGGCSDLADRRTSFHSFDRGNLVAPDGASCGYRIRFSSGLRKRNQETRTDKSWWLVRCQMKSSKKRPWLLRLLPFPLVFLLLVWSVLGSRAWNKTIELSRRCWTLD